MSHTNSTTNYGLPQFLTGDKPAWLTDVNNAFSDIDSAVYAAQSKADTAFADAGNAQADATTAINNAAAADAKGSGALASIEVAFDPTTIYSVGAKVMYNSLLYRCIVAVTTPGPWTGSSNWERINVDTLISATDSKIGNLASLSTSDKSNLVNAANEIKGSIGTEINNNFKRSSTGWGTSVSLPVDRNQFIVLTDNRLFVVWFAGTNEVQVRYLGNNTTASGSGSAVLEGVTFTRNNLRLSVSITTNDAITIIG